MVIAGLRSRWSLVGQPQSVREGRKVGVLEAEGLSARPQEPSCRRILARRSIIDLHRAQENCPGPRLCGVAPSDWIIPEEKAATERQLPSEAFLSIVEASDCRGLTGSIIIGDKDPFFPKIEKLYALMVERGLNGKLQVETGLAHEYPEGFENKLRTALDFVLNEGARTPE